MRFATGKEHECVRKDIHDGSEALGRPGGRPRHIDDEASSERPGTPSRQAPTRTCRSHRLFEPGRLAFEDGLRCLWREVAGCKTGAASCHEQAGEIRSQLPQDRSDSVDAVGNDSGVDNDETGTGEKLSHRRPRVVNSQTCVGGIRDCHNFGLMPHGTQTIDPDDLGDMSTGCATARTPARRRESMTAPASGDASFDRCRGR